MISIFFMSDIQDGTKNVTGARYCDCVKELKRALVLTLQELVTWNVFCKHCRVGPLS